MVARDVARAYRKILREVGLAYRQPRQERSRTILRGLRQGWEGRAGGGLSTRQAEDVHTFLRAHRLHKALVARYNPATDLTAEERIKATARRVGLDVPKDLDLDDPPDLPDGEVGGKKR